jgi:hypothetical protein
MPIVSVPSDSVRTHSCDSVYLRSAGMLMRMLQFVFEGGTCVAFAEHSKAA